MGEATGLHPHPVMTVENRSIAVPQAHSNIVETAAVALMPCLLFGSALVQQPTSWLAMSGQILLWVALIAAAEIIIVLQSGTVFALLGSLLLALKAAQFVSPGNSALVVGYETANGLIFLVAGAILLLRRRAVVERQLRKFFAFSIPVMILQVYGQPYWVQALRTDAHSVGLTEHVVMLPTLFQTDVAGINPMQSRPAGLLHANNFLSIVLLFGLALCFRRSVGRRLTRFDIVLMAVLVLAMAKIALLAFLVFTIIYLVRGPRDTRARIGKLWALGAVYMAGFYLLFPGVFLYDLSPNNAILNYAVRAADFRAVLSGTDVIDLVLVQGIDGSQLALGGIQAGSQSGYAALAKFAPYALVIVPVLGFLFYWRLRKLPRGSEDVSELAQNAVLVALLSPLITSFAGNPLFAFVLGGLALPWIASRKRVRSNVDRTTVGPLT